MRRTHVSDTLILNFDRASKSPRKILNSPDILVPLWFSRFGVGWTRAATGCRAFTGDFHIELGWGPGVGGSALNWSHLWSAKSCSLASGFALQVLFQSSGMYLASLTRQERQIRSISWFRRHQIWLRRACRGDSVGKGNCPSWALPSKKRNESKCCTFSADNLFRDLWS